MGDCVGLVHPQNIVSEAADSGEDAGVLTNTRGVLAQGDVADMVRAILYAPMAANGDGGRFCVDGSIGQIERDLVRGFEPSVRRLKRIHRPLDRDDGGDVGFPFGVRHRGRGVEHADDPRFMAIAAFAVDRLRAREQGRLAAMRGDERA